mgnify:CR=1 FL=1
MYQEPQPMREIHRIRQQMHEEMKNMTTEQKIKYIHKCAEKAKKKYGLKLKRASPVF